MGRQRWLTPVHIHLVLLGLLLCTTNSLGSKKSGPHKIESSKKTVSHKLPSTSFVRIFALPSFEAKLAQHRLGELLAAACKNHARVGSCKLFSAASGAHRVRILQFEEDGKSAVVAYMLQENDEGAERALQECAGQLTGKPATQENGKDYSCYKEKILLPATRDEVLLQLKDQLERIGAYALLEKAPHKTIFLTADPRLIIYQESQRLVGDNGDQDFFLQTIRDSFRRIGEWLSFQLQQFAVLSEGTPILFSHAEDLDDSEQGEIERILDFLDIQDLHVVEETVTAKRGEVRFQKERLRAAILTLPKPLVADIDEFLNETVQDQRMLGRYMSYSRERASLWPHPTTLQNLAVDNTILATAATCSYAPLVINWIKHVHELGIPCYLVVALDDELFSFLEGWVPEHVVRAPPGFTAATPRQYVTAASPAMKHLSRARLSTLKALTDQGYHVAWADADIALTKNVFTIFSRWFDLVATWTGGRSEPMAKIEKVVGYDLKFQNEPGRRISPGFIFLRGSQAAQQFLQKWLQAANSSRSVEDGDILDNLLREREVNSALSIQILPESTFPGGDALFRNASEAYKKEWEREGPAWGHPDSAHQKDDKIQLLSSKSLWKVVPEDPSPTCKRPVEKFLPDGSAVPLWPPAELLEGIAQDNTLLITSATCAYADLLTNWLHHVWDLQIGCFFVAAADEPTAKFLHGWLPEHAALIPPEFAPQVKKFAPKGSAEFASVMQSKPKVIRAALSQEYNVAWSDADVVWLRNPFLLFDRSPDLVLAWADNSVVTDGGVFNPGEFPGKNAKRQVGTSFFFVKPSLMTMKLMDDWALALDSAKNVDEAEKFNQLLRDPEFQEKLTIGIFPSSIFPTGKESAAKRPADELKAAWRDSDKQPAWLHADGAAEHDAKVKALKAAGKWQLQKGDLQPKCSAWGRKLGDDAHHRPHHGR